MINLLLRDPIEVALGTMSILLTGIGVIAELEIPTSLMGLITQFGGLGLAVWLVIHHTTITIPMQQKEHKEERQAMLLSFEQSLKDKREAYQKELTDQREDFKQMLQGISCKFK